MTDQAYAASPRRSQPNGWWGMALFVATEATLFGTLLGTYFTLRLRATQWPPAGIEPPDVAAPLLVTGLLVVSSVAMATASRGATRHRLRTMRGALLAALVVQSTYVGLQIHLLQGDAGRFTPQGSAYGSIYYTLLGVHLAHVALGLLLDVWLLLRLSRGFTEYRAVGVRATAFYWHAVNVIAIVVVLVQVSPAL